MQRGYKYDPVAPVSSNFDPEFTPGLTPQEMPTPGVFGGKYMTDCRKEFPKAGSPGRSSRRTIATTV
jgi:hypothetical protein